MQRRRFLQHSSQIAIGLGVLGFSACGPGANTNAGADTADTTATDPTGGTPTWFQISLAQWSLNRALFGGQLDNLDFAAKAKNDFGIDGVEYVNQFFADKAKDQAYLGQMKQRADDNGVRSLLIMIDGEGELGSTDAAARRTAVENHYKWVDAANFLGCHSIRVNAAGQGTAEAVAAAATEGLRQLSEYARQAGLNVIVENHGGYSSNGAWLAGVIGNVGLDNCGTLPDFGNFCIRNHEEGSGQTGCAEMYDRYQGVREMMPYAKAVSAKSHDFNDQGQETHTDYSRMLQIVKDAGYNGWIGIEYEGDSLSEEEGIRKTKALLQSAGAKLG